MSKIISGGTSGSGSTTDTFDTLTATTFTNTVLMTSPSATITSLSATNIAAPSATITSFNATNATVSNLYATSISGNLYATNATVKNKLNVYDLSSTLFTNSGTVYTTNLTASNSITTQNITINGTLSMNGSLSYTTFGCETIAIGTAAVSFPTATSEFDATTIVYDLDSKFTTFTDKRTSLSAVMSGTDLTISVDDDTTVAVETANGINGIAAIDFPTAMTSYIDADTSATASSTDMTVVVVFKKFADSETLISYEAAQPSFNFTGDTLYLERAGKYDLNTGITITNDTAYIMVATLSTTSGLTIRINGVVAYTNTTSYGSYWFNTALCFFGRHYTTTTKYFVGRLGNVMTAAKILSATEIDNIETYLSAKFDIAIGSNSVACVSDPFQAGSGSCIVNGGIDTVECTTDTLTVADCATIDNTVIRYASIEEATLSTLNASYITTNGLYYEGLTSAIYISSNVYTLTYTNHGIFYIGGTENPTANFSVRIEQLPTDTTKVYTISLVYYQSTGTYYCNAVRASDTGGTYLLGTSSTYVAPKFSGGTPSFSTAPNLVIQQFTVVSFPDSLGATTRYVVSSVAPFS